MHKQVIIDHQVRSLSDAGISAASSAALYGKGVFTTVAIYKGEPFLWEKHWQRLVSNALTVGIDLAEHSRESTRRALDEILFENGVAEGRARITFFDVSTGGVWAARSGPMTSMLIITGDRRTVPEVLRLGASPYPVNSRSPLAGVKSCNYLETLLAYDEAKLSGFDEAVRLNERGEVTSGCIANVFWLKDGRLYTPGLETGCLAGTTREFVLENVECEEVAAPPEVLKEADAIFLTSAGIGVKQVMRHGERELSHFHHPILDLIKRS